MRVVQSTDERSREHLHASLALLQVDATQVDYLFKCSLSATSSELPVLRDALKPHRSLADSEALDRAAVGEAGRYQSASSRQRPGQLCPEWHQVGDRKRQGCPGVGVGQFPLATTLIEALRPVRGNLKAPLATIFQEKSRSETVHSLATDILTDYASDDPNLIATLLMDADAKAYAAFFPIAQRQEAKTLPLFQEVEKKATIPESDKESERVRDRQAERQARAAVALLRMGKVGEITPLLRHSADPRLRSFIINWLSPLEADPTILAAELGSLPATAKPTPPRDNDSWMPSSFTPRPRCGGR